jgi:hypothetical protein
MTLSAISPLLAIKIFENIDSFILAKYVSSYLQSQTPGNLFMMKIRVAKREVGSYGPPVIQVQVVLHRETDSAENAVSDS